MIVRPISKRFFSVGHNNDRRASLVGVRKYNYNSVYRGTLPSVAPFSFFGPPGSPMDIFNSSTNLGYGRIDALGHSISPKVQSLSPIGTGNVIFAVTFVAQAFNDLKHKLTSGPHASNALKLKGGPYQNFNPTRGWQNVATAHSELLENTYTGFLMPYLESELRYKKILNFDDFLKVFLGEFFNDVMLPNTIMLTRSNYAISKKFTPMGSGLVIDLSSDDHNDDSNKYNKWLSHPSYGVVRDAAAFHGFALDKHAPWRLVANLQSPKMLPYIQGKGLLQDKTKATRFFNGKPVPAARVYDVYYDKIYKSDIDALKNTVYNFYTKFIADRPYVSVANASTCSDSYALNQKSITKQHFRKKITFEEMEKKYDDHFWLNQYFLIRLAEGDVDMHTERVERQMRKISYIGKYLGHHKALTYINEYVTMIAPPMTPSLFGAPLGGEQTLQVTGQAAAITGDAPY